MDPWTLSKGLSLGKSNLIKFQAMHHDKKKEIPWLDQNGLLDSDILERSGQ